jgi:hypothetical protein
MRTGLRIDGLIRSTCDGYRFDSQSAGLAGADLPATSVKIEQHLYSSNIRAILSGEVIDHPLPADKRSIRPMF